MTLVLHDSLTGQKRAFIPRDPNRVTMYVCGPTVYNLVHIGNGRPAVVFDVLYRLLRSQYGNVQYVRNVTDIDDKINAAAQNNGEPISELADRFTTAYNEDIQHLGVLPPTVEPRATREMDEIIAMISELIEGGFAYEGEGHVLFHVPADPGYGELSKRSLEDMVDGARIEVAPYKKDPKDFVLWKPSTLELPGWDSPWGRGRPGWHIECSAMIRRHLGRSIDIHGGGNDLTFPHHENERAQSQCANGAEFVGYWLHNGMLTFGGEKMSKSVGNIETIRDLLNEHDGEVLRYALLQGQYRSPLAWGPGQVEQAKSALDRLYQALRVATPDDAAGVTSLAFQDAAWAEVPEAVRAPLEDDLNTPGALAALHGFASAVHTSTDPGERERLRIALLRGGAVLGLLEREPAAYFQSGSALDPAAIDALIEERNAARRNKDFARADAIRADLLDAGVELEDSREGTVWRLRD